MSSADVTDIGTTLNKLRGLISGFSKSGKTTSLPTFLYGPFDYRDIDQRSDAMAYAKDKTMVILACPGETGISALRKYVGASNLTIIPALTEGSSDSSSADWSSEAVDTFLRTAKEAEKNKPDIMFWDGIHGLYNHMLNSNSNGEFLAGEDMDIGPTGKLVQYRAAKFYNRTRHNLTNLIAYYYNTNIPIFGATVAEKWEEAAREQDRPDVKATRYLWPDISGEMAGRLIGMFDFRVSARTEISCLDPTCEYRKGREDHYVWQFYPGGDVAAVGIRGLRINRAMQKDPWIHQNYDDLRQLIDTLAERKVR